MRERILSLKREPLAELSPDELVRVAGGASGLTCLGGACDSDFQQCLTGLGCLSITGC